MPNGRFPELTATDNCPGLEVEATPEAGVTESQLAPSVVVADTWNPMDVTELV